VSHIVNESGPHYKDVRSELRRLGLTDFTQKYVTPEIVDAVNKVSLTKHIESPVSDAMSTTNPRARGRAGWHSMQPEQCSYPHRIEISYKKAEELPEGYEDGWHYRDLDGGQPEVWLHSGDDSRVTSQACYAALSEALLDA
jgi:hypothetical protein